MQLSKDQIEANHAAYRQELKDRQARWDQAKAQEDKRIRESLHRKNPTLMAFVHENLEANQRPPLHDVTIPQSTEQGIQSVFAGISSDWRTVVTQTIGTMGWNHRPNREGISRRAWNETMVSLVAIGYEPGARQAIEKVSDAFQQTLNSAGIPFDDMGTVYAAIETGADFRRRAQELSNAALRPSPDTPKTRISPTIYQASPSVA